MKDKNLYIRFLDEAGVFYHVGIIRRHDGSFRWTTMEDHNGVKQFRASRFLPERTTPEQAYEDLASYAKRKGWEEL